MMYNQQCTKCGAWPCLDLNSCQPRPTKPAAPDDGDRLPPVGANHENSGLFIDCIYPAPTKWEVIAHRGGEAIVYEPKTDDNDQPEVYLLPAREFKSLKERRERDELKILLEDNIRGIYCNEDGKVRADVDSQVEAILAAGYRKQERD